MAAVGADIAATARTSRALRRPAGGRDARDVGAMLMAPARHMLQGRGRTTRYLTSTHACVRQRICRFIIPVLCHYQLVMMINCVSIMLSTHHAYKARIAGLYLVPRGESYGHFCPLRKSASPRRTQHARASPERYERGRHNCWVPTASATVKNGAIPCQKKSCR